MYIHVCVCLYVEMFDVLCVYVSQSFVYVVLWMLFAGLLCVDCRYVCMPAGLPVCLCAWLCVWLAICLSVCMCVCVCVYVCMCCSLYICSCDVMML